MLFRESRIFNWDLLQATLNSYYEARSYKKKKKKFKRKKETLFKDAGDKRFQLAIDLKLFRS